MKVMSGNAPFPRPDPRSMLVILPTWVGDFVMATPALRALRARFLEARVTFLLEANLRDLVRGGDWMDDCLEWPDRRARNPMSKPYRVLVRELRHRSFDWAISFPNSFRAALIARLSGATHRIGYDRDGRGFLLTARIPVKNRRIRVGRGEDGRGKEASPSTEADGARGSADLPAVAQAKARGSAVEKNPVAWRAMVREHELAIPLPTTCRTRFIPMPLVEYYADLVEAIGCPRPSDELELYTNPEDDEEVRRRLRETDVDDGRPIVVLSPGAKYGAAKCWFPERFAEVGDRLIASHGAAVLVTCGPGEEPIAQRVGACMTRGGIVLHEPRLTLGELQSLISRADLLIGNDTGPRHFARAFGVPMVTIFGPTHPDWTATRYSLERIVRINIECGPCQQRVCPLGHVNCIGGVTSDQVYHRAVELLNDRAPRAPITRATGCHV